MQRLPKNGFVHRTLGSRKVKEVMGFTKQIQQSLYGDEYFSPQNVVDMIVPYINRGGTEKCGVRSTKRTASM